jgi:hypothetical protein
MDGTPKIQINPDRPKFKGKTRLDGMAAESRGAGDRREFWYVVGQRGRQD